jgi:hypothetical protein
MLCDIGITDDDVVRQCSTNRRAVRQGRIRIVTAPPTGMLLHLRCTRCVHAQMDRLGLRKILADFCAS